MEFSLKRVNRFYLKSHFLVKKAQKDSIVDVITKICGLNSKTSRAPYISLWNRVKGFKKEMINKLPLADVAPTVLLKGCLKGKGNFKMHDEAISISLFEYVPLEVKNCIEYESKRLYQFFREE